MLSNDILRRLRYAINHDDDATIELMRKGGKNVNREALDGYLKREEDAGFSRCPDAVLAAFLNGWIIEQRGARGETPIPEDQLTNNLILKKIRIACKLEEADLLNLLESGSVQLSRGELSAFFRKPGHKHYRECGDQVMRHLLNGLTRRLRPA